MIRYKDTEDAGQQTLDKRRDHDAGVLQRGKNEKDIVTTECLMKGQKSLVIRHGDHDYLLRITHAGKLILTK